MVCSTVLRPHVVLLGHVALPPLRSNAQWKLKTGDIAIRSISCSWWFCSNVNPGLINHGLLIGGVFPSSYDLILKWYPPINQPRGLLIQGWHYPETIGFCSLKFDGWSRLNGNNFGCTLQTQGQNDPSCQWWCDIFPKSSWIEGFEFSTLVPGQVLLTRFRSWKTHLLGKSDL